MQRSYTEEKKKLTILPRLNSLNHDPGFSFGHDDILTCGWEKQNRTLAASLPVYTPQPKRMHAVRLGRENESIFSNVIR